MIIDKAMSATGVNFTPSNISNCETSVNKQVVIGMKAVFIKNTITTYDCFPPSPATCY